MMIVSALGIIVALSLGFMIGQFGIAKPMGNLVSLLQRMAKGEDVEITGTERRDEVGRTARAVAEIKVMLAEKASEIEAKSRAGRKLAADRAAAEQKMAAEFEDAVGGLVQAAVAGDFSQRVDLDGKTGLVLNVGTSLNTLCQNVATALDDLIEMLDALAEGDLTKRITAHYEGNFATLKDNANKTAGADRDDRRRDQGGDARGDQRLDRDHHEHDRSAFPAHRGAGREPGTDLGLDGADRRDPPPPREEERGERAARSTRRRAPPGTWPCAAARWWLRRSPRWRRSRSHRARSPTSSA